MAQTSRKPDGSDRASVFSALRSFDHVGMDEPTFKASVLTLLSTEGVGIDESLGLAAKGDIDAAAEALAEHFVSREQPPARVYPERVISTGVSDVINHTFTFYGESHHLGPDIDWEYNPGTHHWAHDLNRFTYLDLLVDEYKRTGERVFGRKAIDLILDWISKTDVCDAFVPGKSPYVWGSYLNINGHLATWAGVLGELLPDRFLTPIEMLRIVKSVHDQLAYLEIVIPEHSNNWVVFGSRGMIATALFFHELRDATRFLRYAWDHLLEQIDRQILPDGVQFELTQHYHFGVAKSYATANVLMAKSGASVPAESLEAVRRMTRYLEQTVTPDRLHLAFNDSDADCGEEVIDFLCSPETALATGNRAGRISEFGDFEKLPSEAFPYAGVYMLRDPDHYLAFDGGPYGASHQHEDKLSFWLAAYGRSMIVDPGRFLYDVSNPYRPYLLTTQAHNTIVVDGLAQTSRLHPDSWVSRELLPNYWHNSPERISVGASYTDGYGSDSVPVVHRRNILFQTGEFFLIFDRLEGEGRHSFELRFQFAPGNVETRGGGVVTAWPDANVLVFPTGSVPLQRSIHIGENDPVAGWYSVGYNRLEPAPQAIFRGQAELPVEIATLLYPFRGRQPDAAIRIETDSSGYCVFQGSKEYHYDVAELSRFGREHDAGSPCVAG